MVLEDTGICFYLESLVPIPSMDHEDPSDKLPHQHGLAFGLLSPHLLHLIEKEQKRDTPVLRHSPLPAWRKISSVIKIISHKKHDR